MSDKYLMVDLDDPKLQGIAEIMSNNSCKKILGLIAKKEMSASELSEVMKVPINTVTYNLDKLVKSGLITEEKGFLWSVKGKRIVKYKISNKKIIISPNTSYGIIPALVISGLLSLGIKLFYNGRQAISDFSINKEIAYAKTAVASSPLDAGQINSMIETSQYFPTNEWIWFMFGAIVFLILILAFNWRKVW